MYFKVTYRTPQGQFWLYAWDYIENRKSKRFIINPTGRKTIKNKDINIAIFCNKHNISKEGNNK